jgi:trimeric autotransporter adhesin
MKKLMLSAAFVLCVATPVMATDTVAPCRITDLRTTTIGKHGLVLAWTASGDDSCTGTATAYELRMSQNAITDVNFSQATLIYEGPPQAAGSNEVKCQDGFSPGSTWWFAIKAIDEANNSSVISNVINATLHTSGSDIICE